MGNVEFVVGDAAKAIRPLLEEGLPRPDVVVVDPPRAGLTPRAVRRVIELYPRRLVYVSCNPTTLAGNGKLLDEAGYRLISVTPFDLFPHTPHVECAAHVRAHRRLKKIYGSRVRTLRVLAVILRTRATCGRGAPVSTCDRRPILWAA